MREEKLNFEGIVLAAGLSSRMKDWKPEIKINEIPVIMHTIKPMLEHCDKIYVVGGYNFERLKRLINEGTYFNAQLLNRIVLVENKDYSEGMFSSVKCGVNMVENPNGVFIIPGDIPFVKSSTYSKLIKSFAAEAGYKVFIPTARVESDSSVANDMFRKGHPILIRGDVVNDILSYADDAKLSDVLEELECKFVQVNDRGIFIDIDNKDDLEKAKKYFGY